MMWLPPGKSSRGFRGCGEKVVELRSDTASGFSL